METANASWRLRTGRSFAASSKQDLGETPLGLLEQLTRPRDAEDDAEGRLLSHSGGVLRVLLPGKVAVGDAVDFEGGGRGIVLRFDRRGCVVAPIASQPRPLAGERATVSGKVMLRADKASLGGLSFVTVPELLHVPQGVGDNSLVVEGTTMLKTPSVPPPFQRRPLRSRMPSGLAAIEIAAPLGHGHRIGFIGAPGTGKSSAMRMLLAAQTQDTAVVYLSHAPKEKLERELQAVRAPTTVIHTSHADTLGARYLAPLCAVHLAQSLQRRYPHVLLVLDDVVAFAEAVGDIQAGVPLSVQTVMGSILDAAHCGKDDRALSVATVLDFVHDDALPTWIKELWRAIDPSLDICVSFEEAMARKGMFPAIDVDSLAVGFAPKFQAPFMKAVRRELTSLLSSSKELKIRLEGQKELGLQLEDDEKEDFVSSEAARMMLSQSKLRSLQELAVLATAALVFHFPAVRGGRPPNVAEVAAFQEELLACVQSAHPAIWNSLGALEDLSAKDAEALLGDLAATLLRHRHDFRLTCAEI